MFRSILFHLQFIWHPYTAIPAESTAPLYETDHTQTHPLRLFYSATASMAQEQSQELPVEQQLSNSTGGDAEVKLSTACYSLINHLRATAQHIQQKVKVKTCWLWCTNYRRVSGLQMTEMHLDI